MSAEAQETTGAAVELGAADRRALLAAAREAIAAQLGGRRAARPAANGALARAAGAFVTLRRATDGELRGCVGRMEASDPLLDTVAEMAVAAATHDTRFRPVNAAELASLRIEISVLSPLAAIAAADVEVGRHGLLLRYGERRGVLLPQVPLEYGWDRESFLAHTCEKAGLPAGTWKLPGVELLGFTATVFGEDE